MDELTVQVEHDESVAASGDGGVTSWCEQVGERLRTVLGVSAKVAPLPKGTFERTDFKARRVIDQRAMTGADGAVARG